MTNKEAIEFLKNMIDTQSVGAVLPNGEKALWQYHIEALNMAISALQPHWIPVTERLPDKDGRFLVTCSKIGAWVVDWNIWHCEPKPEWLWEQGVTAWMPMPEPWEGEEKND